MSLPTYLKPQPYNSIIDADSYKVPHWMFYREGIKSVYSFIESRGGEHDTIMMAGLQPLLYEKIAQPVQDWEIEEAGEFFAKHFGFPSYFNKNMWDEIVNKWDRKLPLEIRALPEGLLVPKHTPMVTVQNHGGKVLAPLTSYKETMLMRNVWPACSIATRVFRMKQRLKPFYDETSDNPISPFAVLDFSSRGVFGDDHSKIAGAVFCFMFQGSDNMLGIRHANYYYFHEMSAFSVAATEHSIASGWVHDDDGYIDNCLEKALPNSILSMVGDTWNIFEFAKKLCRGDRQAIIANKNLSIVGRPDSGERYDVLPQFLATLYQGVGARKNSKGYDVLNLNMKALWADGMNEDTITEPNQIAKDMKIAADCVLTGAGGGIAAAKLDRDTDRWAMKASTYLMEDGSQMEIFKDPITDPGKKSKRGRFTVRPDGYGHTLVGRRFGDTEFADDLLGIRYLNGDVLNAAILEDIRRLVDSQL
jgi:nicotinamide phosphoribosyltransferase